MLAYEQAFSGLAFDAWTDDRQHGIYPRALYGYRNSNPFPAEFCLRHAAPSHGIIICFLRCSKKPGCGPSAHESGGSLDFQLSEEQLQLKKSIHEFAEREIAPNVMKWDEASYFPIEVIRELGKMGAMGVIFPVEYGGAGLGYVEYSLIVEELSRVDGSVGIIVAAH